MKVICASKAELGYNASDSSWVLIDETHWAFDGLKARGFDIRDADEKEKKLFNVVGDELTIDDFSECGSADHFPKWHDRGHFVHVCPSCGKHVSVRTRI